MFRNKLIGNVIRQITLHQDCCHHLLLNAPAKQRFVSTRPVQWRFETTPGKGRKADFLVPVLTCTGTSVGVFTAFALLDLKQRKEASAWRLRPRKRTVPAWVPDNLQTTYLNAKDSWQSIPDTKRVLYSIIAANLGVALLWRIPALQGFMLKNFTLQLPPQNARPWTFLTSNFSHAGALHLGVNMLALSSFGFVVAEDFGANQFAAFYLSAGMASSLVAYLARLRRATGGRSLGASGAVYACFAATALMHPDAHGAFIFLPGIPIRLGDLLPVLMCLDVTGVVLGWRYLDHWGHLGGALFGILYTKYGHHAWDQRDAILDRVGLKSLVV